MSWDGHEYDDFEDSWAPEWEAFCDECGKGINKPGLCRDCDDDYDDDDYQDECHFADPGGRSALRAETYNNPRNLPCPSCDEPNRLTPADRARGYQCDTCADMAERGY